MATLILIEPQFDLVRVTLSAEQSPGAGEVVLGVRPGELLDYRTFQEAALSRLGMLIRFPIEQQAQNEFELRRQWLELLSATPWLPLPDRTADDDSLDFDSGLRTMTQEFAQQSRSRS